MKEATMGLSKNAVWMVGAFALCFFAGGLIFWRGSSYQEYMENGPPLVIPVLLAGVAIVLTGFCGVGFFPSAIVVGCALPAAIFARIVMDGIQNPTSHNLWPIEVAIVLVFGMTVAVPSAGLGWLLRRLMHNGRASPILKTQESK
jgi:hypothetical protein